MVSMPPLLKVSALAPILLWIGALGSTTATPAPSGGVLNARLATKGKARGTLRVFAGPTNCRKRRAEGAISWSLAAAAGCDSKSGRARAAIASVASLTAYVYVLSTLVRIPDPPCSSTVRSVSNRRGG